MFSSNQLFEVTGDNEAALREVLAFVIPMNGTIRSYRLAANAILVFGRDAGCRGYTDYPMDVTAEKATEIAMAHLRSAEVLKVYQHMEQLDDHMDGSCRRGWRVFYPGWRGYNDGYNDIDKSSSPDQAALIAIAPFWTFYHK